MMAKEKRSAEWILVTPNVAKEYLATSEGNPRYGSSSKLVNEQAVKKMVDDLKNNRWFDTGEAIQFDWNGHLVNGHHRLSAIISSGKSQELLVVKGISPQAVPHIDGINKRPLPQRLAAYGYGADIANGKTVGAIRLAICFRKGRSFMEHYMSDEWFMDFVNEHQKAYAFAYEATGLGYYKNVTSGSEFAHAIAEAYEDGVDPMMLKRFCDVVNTGRYNGDGETAAIELRNWKLSNPKDFNARNSKDRMANSEAIQTYLNRFVEGAAISRKVANNQLVGVYTFHNIEKESDE